MHFTWLIAARLAGCKAVWHQHTPGFGPYLVSNVLVRLAHSIVCVSEFTAKYTPPAMARRITVVNNPFDMAGPPPDRSESRAALLREMQCETNCRIVGFFGNLIQRKRHLVFVRAAALIKEALDTPAVFALFGADREDSAEKVRRAARELGIDDSIRLMGFRSPVEPWMAACDVVLAPAVDEGFGRGLVEAMSVGTPVVATGSGGHAEIVRDGETGLLVPPDDAETLADAALRVLQDPDYADGLADRALAHVRQAYPVEPHVTTIMRMYDELLARGNLAAGQEAAVFRKPS
jgi:glycosyltransferase involved in cell wall biosynthesis